MGEREGIDVGLVEGVEVGLDEGTRDEGIELVGKVLLGIRVVGERVEGFEETGILVGLGVLLFEVSNRTSTFLLRIYFEAMHCDRRHKKITTNFMPERNINLQS